KAVLLKGTSPEAILDAASREQCTIVWLLVPWAQDILSALVSATPYLRSIIGQEIELRRVPNLKFFYDDAYENGLHMDALLAKLRADGQMGSED
ncbi:MAG: ribosome-binding factor A, partial [Proteobacteria bacterium]|nr:ribosome-binding factor A [Pseudomonadota bacterium]